MKNLNISLILILAVLFSCDTLDKNPLDSLVSEQAFASEENLNLFINSLYIPLMNTQSCREVYGWPSSNGPGFTSDMASDLTIYSSVAESYYIPGVYKSLDEPLWSWNELRNINYFLANYQQADIPESVKNHFAGIARWFRAKFYFEKVKRFGDVPWYDQPLGSDDEDLYKTRDSREFVMDRVLEDIDFAINNIYPDKDNTSTTITKWVALGLKSRICLFEGTFRKYHPEIGLGNSADQWLKLAEDAALQVMESGQYSVYSTDSPNVDYHTLFTSDNAVQEEVMLAIAHNESQQVFNSTTYAYSDAGGRYLTSLLKRFVNTYLNIDGSRFTDIPGYDTIFFTREVENRDLRLQQTIRTPFYKRTDGSSPPPNGALSPTLYHLMKWSNDDPYWDNKENRNVNDVTLMRYAEILLNYAEAKAELGTFNENDWNKTVAMLRQRAGIMDLSMPTTIDNYMKTNFYPDVNSVAIMEIRRERAIELIQEKFRWDDLIRWKVADNLERKYDGIYVPELNKAYDLNQDGKSDIMFVKEIPNDVEVGVYYYIIDNSTKELSLESSGNLLLKTNMVKEFPDYKYFAPIPLFQLQINKNLTQNPGWD